MPEIAKVVDVNFQTKVATVVTKPGVTLDRANVEAALKTKGYGVAEMKTQSK